MTGYHDANRVCHALPLIGDKKIITVTYLAISMTDFTFVMGYSSLNITFGVVLEIRVSEECCK
jgi:hypothetical protein